MSTKDTQAFPIVGPLDHVQCPGMTLRDYFAAAVMPSINARGWGQLSAEEAYRKADEMLKARAQQEQHQ